VINEGKFRDGHRHIRIPRVQTVEEKGLHGSELLEHSFRRRKGLGEREGKYTNLFFIPISLTGEELTELGQSPLATPRQLALSGGGGGAFAKFPQVRFPHNTKRILHLLQYDCRVPHSGCEQVFHFRSCKDLSRHLFAK
jgi:hypothetical protein